MCVYVCVSSDILALQWALVYNSDLDMMGRRADSHNQLTHVVDWQLGCPDVLQVGEGGGGGCLHRDTSPVTSTSRPN